MTSEEIKSVMSKAKSMWREAAIWALLAAFALEFGINVLSRRTLWNRVDALEEKVKNLDHIRELEELQTRQQLHELRQKSDDNKVEIEAVEKKVEKKAH